MILAAFASLHAQKPSFHCGPWVTNVSETGFTVVWTTPEKTFCRVEVAPDDGTPWALKERTGFYQVVSGLEPGRSYRYKVYGKVVTDDSDAYVVPVLNEAGVDLMLSGHHHEHIYMEKGSCGNDFPIIANDDTDRLEFTAGADGYKVVTFDQEGNAGHIYEVKTSEQ